MLTLWLLGRDKGRLVRGSSMNRWWLRIAGVGILVVRWAWMLILLLGLTVRSGAVEVGTAEDVGVGLVGEDVADIPCWSGLLLGWGFMMRPDSHGLGCVEPACLRLPCLFAWSCAYHQGGTVLHIILFISKSLVVGGIGVVAGA